MADQAIFTTMSCRVFAQCKLKPLSSIPRLDNLVAGISHLLRKEAAQCFFIFNDEYCLPLCLCHVLKYTVVLKVKKKVGIWINVWCPREESNLDSRLRSPEFYPLNYRGGMMLVYNTIVPQL